MRVTCYRVGIPHNRIIRTPGAISTQARRNVFSKQILYHRRARDRIKCKKQHASYKSNRLERVRVNRFEHVGNYVDSRFRQLVSSYRKFFAARRTPSKTSKRFYAASSGHSLISNPDRVVAREHRGRVQETEEITWKRWRWSPGTKLGIIAGRKRIDLIWYKVSGDCTVAYESVGTLDAEELSHVWHRMLFCYKTFWNFVQSAMRNNCQNYNMDKIWDQRMSNVNTLHVS